MVKVENAGNLHFLLYPPCFLPFMKKRNTIVGDALIFSSTKTSNLYTSIFFLVKISTGNACENELWLKSCYVNQNFACWLPVCLYGRACILPKCFKLICIPLKRWIPTNRFCVLQKSTLFEV